MDTSRAISDYLNDKCRDYSSLPHRDLYDLLKYKEVDIEKEKDIMFRKKLDYFSLANHLKQAMLRDTGYKQLKPYFRHEIGLNDDDAKRAANRYNSACKTYKNFDIIVKNVAYFPKIDIRDLTLSQLKLAVKMEWLYLHNASLRSDGEKRPANDELDQQQVDWNDVYKVEDVIFNSNWYKDHLSEKVYCPSELGYPKSKFHLSLNLGTIMFLKYACLYFSE